MSAMVRLASSLQILAYRGVIYVQRTDGDTAETDHHAASLLLACRRPQPLEVLRNEYDPLLIDRFLETGLLVAWGNDDIVRVHAATLGSDAPSPEVASSLGDDLRLVREYTAANPVRLPAPGPVTAALTDVLATRQSARCFPRTPLPVTTLATLLATALGTDGPDPVLPRVAGGPPARPAYPSPGALYPVEVDLLAWNVETLPTGAYRYLPFSHRLDRTRDTPDGVVAALLPDHDAMSAAGLVVLWVDLLSAAFEKYGGKGYRLALLEAGHLMQNLVLTAAALDVPALPVAGFHDAELGDHLGLRAAEQVPIYALLVGGLCSRA